MHEDILVLDDQIMPLSATSFRSRTTFTGNVHSTLPKQIHVSRCALTPSSGWWTVMSLVLYNVFRIGHHPRTAHRANENMHCL